MTTKKMMRSLILPIILLLLPLALSVHAQQTPPPKRNQLEKHKRGYTVYTPAGLEDKKTYPVVIWLHPLKGSMNTTFHRDWWTELNQRKIFMVFPESVDPKEWRDEDIDYLKDLAADLPRQAAIDRKRLVLFGYQAGGQFAFEVVRKHPSTFASVITMAAYPISVSEQPVLYLFPAGARRSLSVLMVVGTADNLRMFCRQAAEELQAKGFAAGLVEVPDAGPTYLTAAKPGILAWLDKIVAGERPSVTLPEAEQAARNALAESAHKTFDNLLKTPAEPEPDGSVDLKLPNAGLTLHLPPGWKTLADEPPSARLTTVEPPRGPLLLQLSLGKNPRGLDRAIKDHETLNSTRGIRYTTLQTAQLKIDDRTWTLQQVTCLSYHRQADADGKRHVVDVPSILTVAYLPLDDKGREYIRVVFLYTEATADKAHLPTLFRQVLSTVRTAPPETKETPVIE